MKVHKNLIRKYSRLIIIISLLLLSTLILDSQAYGVPTFSSYSRSPSSPTSTDPITLSGYISVSCNTGYDGSGAIQLKPPGLSYYYSVYTKYSCNPGTVSYNIGAKAGGTYYWRLKYHSIFTSRFGDETITDYYSSAQSFVVTQAANDPPTITSISPGADTNRAENSVTSITAQISDPEGGWSAIDTRRLYTSYRTSPTAGYSSYTYQNMGYTASSVYDYVAGRPYGYTTRYYLYAKDALGASTTSSVYYITHTDNTNPTLSAVTQINGIPYKNQAWQLSAVMTDSGSGPSPTLSERQFKYNINGGTWTTVDADSINGGTQYVTIPAATTNSVFNIGDTVQVQAIGEDATEHHGTGSISTVTVGDNAAPTAGTPYLVGDLKDSGPSTWRVSLTDVGDGVTSATIWYRTTAGYVEGNPMSLYSGTINSGIWQGIMNSLSYGTLLDIEVKFQDADTSTGMQVSQENLDNIVLDGTSPDATSWSFPTEINTNTQNFCQVTATDSSPLTVISEYRISPDFGVTWESWIPNSVSQNGDMYTSSFNNMVFGEFVQYRFTLSDNQGNFPTEIYSGPLVVRDGSAPDSAYVLSPTNPKQGETMRIEVNATDLESGVDTVKLHADGDAIGVTMSYDGTNQVYYYEYTHNNVYQYAGSYYVKVKNYDDDVTTLGTVSYTIDDGIAPYTSWIDQPFRDTSDVVTITFTPADSGSGIPTEEFDNMGFIINVYQFGFFYRVSGGGWTEVFYQSGNPLGITYPGSTNGVYIAKFTVSQNLALVEYKVELTDNAGNGGAIIESFTTDENTPPAATVDINGISLTQDTTIDAKIIDSDSTTVIISVAVSDMTEISEIYYRLDGSSNIYESGVFGTSYQFTINMGTLGYSSIGTTHDIEIFLSDTLSNWIWRTFTWRYQDNSPPVITSTVETGGFGIKDNMATDLKIGVDDQLKGGSDVLLNGIIVDYSTDGTNWNSLVVSEHVDNPAGTNQYYYAKVTIPGSAITWDVPVQVRVTGSDAGGNSVVLIFQYDPVDNVEPLITSMLFPITSEHDDVVLDFSAVDANSGIDFANLISQGKISVTIKAFVDREGGPSGHGLDPGEDDPDSDRAKYCSWNGLYYTFPCYIGYSAHGNGVPKPADVLTVTGSDIHAEFAYNENTYDDYDDPLSWGFFGVTYYVHVEVRDIEGTSSDQEDYTATVIDGRAPIIDLDNTLLDGTTATSNDEPVILDFHIKDLGSDNPQLIFNYRIYNYWEGPGGTWTEWSAITYQAGPGYFDVYETLNLGKLAYLSEVEWYIEASDSAGNSETSPTAWMRVGVDVLAPYMDAFYLTTLINNRDDSSIILDRIHDNGTGVAYVALSIGDEKEEGTWVPPTWTVDADTGGLIEGTFVNGYWLPGTAYVENIYLTSDMTMTQIDNFIKYELIRNLGTYDYNKVVWIKIFLADNAGNSRLLMEQSFVSEDRTPPVIVYNDITGIAVNTKSTEIMGMSTSEDLGGGYAISQMNLQYRELGQTIWSQVSTRTDYGIFDVSHNIAVTGWIPRFPAGYTIEYRWEMIDYGGNSNYDYGNFTIVDSIAPVVQVLDSVQGFSDHDTSFDVRVLENYNPIRSVHLDYRVNLGDWILTTLTSVTDIYNVVIPSQNPGDTVEWIFFAIDEQNNTGEVAGKYRVDFTLSNLAFYASINTGSTGTEIVKYGFDGVLSPSMGTTYPVAGGDVNFIPSRNIMALMMDGVDDNLLLDGISLYNRSFSIESIITPLSLKDQTIFTTDDHLLKMALLVNGGLEITVGTSSVFDMRYQAEEYYHIITSYDYSTKNVTITINGQILGWSILSNFTSTSTISYIGGDQNFLHGSVDMFAIHSGVIPNILAQYYSSDSYSDVLGLYNFDAPGQSELLMVDGVGTNDGTASSNIIMDQTIYHYSARFDGSDVFSINSLGLSEFTFMVDVKTTSDGIILDKDEDISLGIINSTIMFRIATDNNTFEWISTGYLSSPMWQSISFGYNGTNATIRVDNLLVYDQWINGTYTGTGSPITFGSDGVSYFSGLMDNIYIFGRPDAFGPGHTYTPQIQLTKDLVDTSVYGNTVLRKKYSPFISSWNFETDTSDQVGTNNFVWSGTEIHVDSGSGNGLMIDGSGYGTLANTGFAPMNTFSMGLEFRLDQDLSVDGYLFELSQSYGFYISSTEDLVVYIETVEFGTLITSVPIDIGQYYRVVATYDQDGLSLFLEGDKVSSLDLSASTQTLVGGSVFNIGQRDQSNWFSGLIDEPYLASLVIPDEIIYDWSSYPFNGISVSEYAEINSVILTDADEFTIDLDVQLFDEGVFLDGGDILLSYQNELITGTFGTNTITLLSVDSKRHHIMILGENSSITVYLDGVLMNTTLDVFTTISVTNLVIGADQLLTSFSSLIPYTIGIYNGAIDANDFNENTLSLEVTLQNYSGYLLDAVIEYSVNGGEYSSVTLQYTDLHHPDTLRAVIDGLTSGTINFRIKLRDSNGVETIIIFSIEL